MEKISNQQKGLRFGTINFSDYEGLEVSGSNKVDVLSQELQNSALKDLVNENENAQGGPMVSKDGDHWKQNYPLRHEVKNCFYFVKYGWCMYGSNCRFNHPYNQLPQVAKEFPDQYIPNGSYQYQYGSDGWFDHSEPSSMEGGFLPSGYTGLEDTMQSGWSVTGPVNEIGLYNPYMYQQEQIFPSSEWSGNQGLNKEWNASIPATFSMETAAAVAKPFQPNQARLLPIGSPKPEEQPEENLNFGFGFRNPRVSSSTLNDGGLPLRSATEACAFYGGYGVCKEGPKCKFNHAADLPKQVPRAGSDEAEVLAAGSHEAQVPPPGSQEAPPPQLSHPSAQDKNGVSDKI